MSEEDYISPGPKETHEFIVLSQEALDRKIARATNPLHNKIIHLETQLKQAQAALEDQLEFKKRIFAYMEYVNDGCDASQVTWAIEQIFNNEEPTPC